MAFPTSIELASYFGVAYNNLATTLSQEASASDTTIYVASTTNYTAPGWATIEDEIFSYIGKTSGTFTGCTRGADNTTAAVHTSGKAVSLTFPAIMWERVIAELRATQSALKTDAFTIAGVKTFSSFPVTPSSAPTTNYQVANKKYVDDAGTTTYADKLNLAIAMGATPDEQVDVDADCLTLFNATFEAKSVTSVNLTISNTASGANGLDTGSVAADTWYYIWVVAKADGTTAGLLSVSTTIATITLPTDYLYGRLIGALHTDGTSDFMPGKWSNNWFYYDLAQQVYSGNGVTSWTTQDLSVWVPDGFARAEADLKMLTNAGANSVGFRKNGDTADTLGGPASGAIFRLPVDDSGIVQYINGWNARAHTWGVAGYKNIE